MKKLKSFFVILFFLSFSAFFIPLSGALAGEPAVEQEKQANIFAEAAGLNPSITVGGIIAAIAQIFLGLLGIIFIILLIFAGFQWMTASGNEEKVTKAKETITRAIIGLAIIIAAYSITYFVFNALNESVGGGTIQNEGGSSG
jgi:amino acid transporter